MEIELCCGLCKKLFTRKVYPSSSTPAKVYCSKVCKLADKEYQKTKSANSWTPERRKKYSEMNSGEGNSNFGVRWTQSQKDEQSKLKTQFYIDNPDIAYECGKSNRGVKFSKERIYNMHGNRTSDSYSRTPSDDTRIKIGMKSKEKWTPEYKKEHRKRMVSLGYWADRVDEPYRYYYRDSNWVGSMIPTLNESDLEKFKHHGFYNKKTNTKGLVRDHIVSRKHGYTFNLPECIIRHPENLQLIPHAENVSKGFLDRRLTETEVLHQIELLLTRIQSTTKEWHEQDSCITYIKERREDVR